MSIIKAKNMPAKIILEKPAHFPLMPYFPGAVKKQEMENDVQLLTI
ncbi:MAG: hypothetical protein K9N10_12585 [Deltaproteobacteria bacterium]|nr:hypothetical protein [Deltaproteobacteria bacterium]